MPIIISTNKRRASLNNTRNWLRLSESNRSLSLSAIYCAQFYRFPPAIVGLYDAQYMCVNIRNFIQHTNVTYTNNDSSKIKDEINS